MADRPSRKLALRRPSERQPLYLSYEDATARLGVHRSTLGDWIAQGRLDRVLIGGRGYLTMTSLSAVLSERLHRGRDAAVVPPSNLDRDPRAQIAPRTAATPRETAGLLGFVCARSCVGAVGAENFLGSCFANPRSCESRKGNGACAIPRGPFAGGPAWDVLVVGRRGSVCRFGRCGWCAAAASALRGAGWRYALAVRDEIAGNARVQDWQPAHQRKRSVIDIPTDHLQSVVRATVPPAGDWPEARFGEQSTVIGVDRRSPKDCYCPVR